MGNFKVKLFKLVLSGTQIFI